MKSIDWTVKNLIASKKKTTMCVTGGGTGVFQTLLQNGGGSDFLIEGIINYHPETTHQLIGKVPDHYSSPETARALAVAAYNRCLAVVKDPREAHGLACTCKLGLTNREERKGRNHDIHIAYHDYHSTKTFSLLLKNPRSRATEEYLTSNLILDVMSHCYLNVDMFNLDNNLLTHITKPEVIDGDVFTATEELAEVVAGTRDYVICNNKYDLGLSPNIFPGSFNPFHDGHLKIAQVAFEKTGLPVWLELAVTNTDKPQIDFLEISKRVIALEDVCKSNKCLSGLIITNSPLFKDKARIFPDRTVYVIGSDTYNRIGNNKYVSLVETQRAVLGKHQSFLVFPRKDHKLYYPNGMILMSEFISDTEYQDTGVSSTELRKKLVVPSLDH